MPSEPTRVLNVRYDPFDVYVGRRAGKYAGSIWGNPFKMRDWPDPVGSFRNYVLARPDLLARVGELRGKRLGCWCAPKSGVTAADKPYVCHGQVLAELADTAEAGGPHA